MKKPLISKKCLSYHVWHEFLMYIHMSGYDNSFSPDDLRYHGGLLDMPHFFHMENIMRNFGETVKLVGPQKLVYID